MAKTRGKTGVLQITADNLDKMASLCDGTSVGDCIVVGDTKFAKIGDWVLTDYVKTIPLGPETARKWVSGRNPFLEWSDVWGVACVTITTAMVWTLFFVIGNLMPTMPNTVVTAVMIIMMVLDIASVVLYWLSSKKEDMLESDGNQS